MQKGKNDKEEQRQIRLEKKRERSRSSLKNETEEKRQARLEKKKELDRSRRQNETEEQRRIRLEKKKKRARSNRANESEEQRLIRLEEQRKRSQQNREKKKREKQTHESIHAEQNTDMRSFNPSSWPEPIPRGLKESCLQQFLKQMSMSVLSEVTCAVCNIRTPAKDAKKIQLSKIPNARLLKVSKELSDLVRNTQPSSLQHSTKDIENFNINSNTKMAEHGESNI